MRRRGGRVRSAMAWAAMAVLVAGWALFLRPPFLGGPATVIGVSGISMTPTMEDGDLTLVRKQPSYGVGDVIAYRIPEGQPGAGHNIIHRVVGGDGGRGFVTKGDHNPGVDIWRPKHGDVLGEVAVHVPHVAGWVGVLRTPTGIAALAGLLTFALIVLPGRRDEDPIDGGEPSTAAAPAIPRAVEIGIVGVVSAALVHQVVASVRSRHPA